MVIRNQKYNSDQGQEYWCLYVSSDIGATIARSALSLDHGMDWLKLQVKLLVRAQRVTGAANLL